MSEKYCPSFCNMSASFFSPSSKSMSVAICSRNSQNLTNWSQNRPRNLRRLTRLSLAFSSRLAKNSIATSAALRSSLRGLKQISSTQCRTRLRSAISVTGSDKILEGIQPNLSLRPFGILAASKGAQYFCHSAARPSMACFRTAGLLSTTRSATNATIPCGTESELTRQADNTADTASFLTPSSGSMTSCRRGASLDPPM